MCQRVMENDIKQDLKRKKSVSFLSRSESLAQEHWERNASQVIAFGDLLPLNFSYLEEHVSRMCISC